ncbi:protein serine/threonine phosphatase 2C [Irpex rosettiformis]|uniref:Protein serine/threonine phosphatase 2C n=1 Tax=Irpex rosettiformis TaxID=378272 RepID=A0ACB8U4N8_9APHY|nr:protein serine/threonine phosphatase 2C [Irpex rosettiformis]
MLSRLWKPVIGTAVFVGTPSYLYFKYASHHQSHIRESFDLPVRVKGLDGKAQMTTKTLGLLAKEEVDRKLTECAVQASMTRNGVVWRQATAYVPANDPIEDANASEVLMRDVVDASGLGDLMFFAVMDGHGGYMTSRLLSKVLIPTVALELQRLINHPVENVQKTGTLSGLKERLWPTAKPASTALVPLDADPRLLTEAIQRAFLNLDSEIVDAPLRLLAEEMVKQGEEKQFIPDLSQHHMAQATLNPAMSGSCALMALFDTAHQNLYVACTGDSRAVAGVWEESADGTGHWRVDVLSEDQTGRNPNELKRIQSEHPSSEHNTVIMRGRVLGGLEPTRAFGDARYKWSRDAQAILNHAFMRGSGTSMRSAPALLQTPPYVTALPVVTHRKLSLPTTSNTSNSKSSLRFIILATDGLWDELTSEDAVALVGGYLLGLKGVVPKHTLPTLVPTATSSSSPTIQGKGKSKHPISQVEGEWTFEDSNVSSHLIRNAFGGGDEDRVRQLLSIPTGLARSYRDDVTCTVVWWEEGKGSDGDIKVEKVRLVEEVKAKL